MEKNLREPKEKVNGTKTRVQLFEQVIENDFPDELNNARCGPDYGVVEDYYEIFGDIEEFTV